jgi:hypothetical protein
MLALGRCKKRDKCSTFRRLPITPVRRVIFRRCWLKLPYRDAWTDTAVGFGSPKLFGFIRAKSW